MTTRLGQKYDLTAAPPYLSYPAVGQWRQSVTEADALAALGRADVSRSLLYFHFPFCEALCFYCACYMEVTADPGARYDRYLDALERELALKLDAPGAGRPAASEVHFGGGTPTYMDCRQLERAAGLVSRRFRRRRGANFSIEAYPDERLVTREKLELLARLGFTQISFGVESLDPKVLKAIHRAQGAGALRRGVERARAAGLGVHVDLVYGLPYQTPRSLRETARAVLDCAPDRLAAFPFVYSPLSIPHQRLIPARALPDSAGRWRLYEVLREEAGERGYAQVGADHWVRGEKDPLAAAARRGELVYNFQGYEPEKRSAVLGLGASAISFLEDRYFQNLPSERAYRAALERGRLPLVRRGAAALGFDDRLRHRVIMGGLMSRLRVDKDAVEADFRIVFDDYFRAELGALRGMERDGLVEGCESRSIVVTPRGLPFLRVVSRVFDAYAASGRP